MKPTYVFGHRNPDNDSICSAVAYAHLKNILDPENLYVPARLGNAPQETMWAFDRWGVELPQVISHIHMRVSDAMTANPVTIHATKTMVDAGKIMHENDLRALPVVDDEGRVIGLLSQRRLAMRYLEEKEIGGFSQIPVSVKLLADAVNGEILVGDEDQVISGNVEIAASEPGTALQAFNKGDVVILGNRRRTQPLAINAGIAALVITMGEAPEKDVLDLAREKGCAIILTKARTYETARRISLAQAVGDIMDTELALTSPDNLLSEAADDLLASTQRELVVVDEDRRVVGILTRTDLARRGKRRVVLVDHNESSQSAPGIETASVVEIVDHHRVGDIQSSGPILFLNMPVGATATIVALRFFETNTEMPTGIAGILLSALLTDTVLLKSPTTTPIDHEVSEKLASIAGVEVMQYGLELFSSKSSGKAFDVATMLTTDLKEFRVGENVIAIVQYEAVSLDELYARVQEVRDGMDTLRAGRNYDLLVLMATDIIREGSEIFVSGKVKIAERAFDTSFESGSVWMPGVLSRKKQIASRFMDAS